MGHNAPLLANILSGLVVASVTQVSLVLRGYLEEQKRRRFLRADLASEARECIRILNLFMSSIEDHLPESRTGLGVGLAIYIAPIRCREEYERLSATIKNALPALSDQEFQTASELKGHLRLVVGYTDACDRYFKQLQEAGLGEGVSGVSLPSRREIFRRFGSEAKQKISSSSQRVMEKTFKLVESLEAHGFGLLTPFL